jgi:hypothetical protein
MDPPRKSLVSGRIGCLVHLTVAPFQSNGELGMLLVFLSAAVLWRPRCVVVFSRLLKLNKVYTSSLPNFLDKRLTYGGEIVSLSRRPTFTPPPPQEDSWYSFLSEAELTPGP